jgi:hypothetical protein
LQFNVWAAHYQPHQVIYIDSSATIQLNQSDKARFVTSFEWNTLNTDESQGYSRSSQLLTGDDIFDVSIQRFIKGGLSGEYSPGYLYTKFKIGSLFRRAPKPTPVSHPCSLMVLMRLLDNSGDPNAVVAEIRSGRENQSSD